MWQFIKTGLLVTVVTALIWIYAEAESLRPRDFTVELAFQVEPGSNKVIDILDADGQVIRGTDIVRATVTVEGSAAAFERIEPVLRRPLRLGPDLDGVPADPGKYPIDLQPVLRMHPEIRDKGVNIRKVDPPQARILVDEIVERTLPVQVVIPSGELEALPEVKPPQVVVKLPRGEADLLPEGVVLTARPDQASWSRLLPGRRETISGVRLELPGQLANSVHARATPATVDVSVTVRNRTATIRVPSVPVHLRIAPLELGRWNIEIPEPDRFLTDVTVTGPSDLVKQIEDKTIPLIAMVPLSFEELERGITSKEAIFCELPTQLRIEVARRAVRLTVTRRETAATSPPPTEPEPDDLEN